MTASIEAAAKHIEALTEACKAFSSKAEPEWKGIFFSSVSSLKRALRCLHDDCRSYLEAPHLSGLNKRLLRFRITLDVSCLMLR